MKVIINGQPHEIGNGVSMSELLAHLNTGIKGVAVAVQGRIVPRSEWETYIVSEGEDITLIRATCGG